MNCRYIHKEIFIIISYIINRKWLRPIVIEGGIFLHITFMYVYTDVYSKYTTVVYSSLLISNRNTECEWPPTNDCGWA